MDNLNTHRLSSLYEAFEPAEGEAQLQKKLEIHYTPQARQLAEHGRDRTGSAGAPVSGPPDTGPADIEAGNPSRTRAAEPRRNSSGLAFHHPRRTHQAQVPLSLNPTLMGLLAAVQMTSNLVPGVNALVRGDLFRAMSHCERTARMKGAARGRIQGRGNLSAQLNLFPLLPRVGRQRC